MLERLLGSHADLSPLQDRVLNCVVSTQRSGSTLLCRDLSNATNLGAIDEYFIAYLNKVQDSGALPPPRVFFEMCQRRDGAFNVKLMINQLHLLGGMIATIEEIEAGKKAASPLEYYSLIAIDRFFTAFADTNLIFLRRNDPFAQAFSHFRAQKTGVYHVERGGQGTELPPNRALPEEGLEFVFLIDREVRLVHDQELRFRRLMQHSPLRVFHLTYQEVVEDYPGYIHRFRDFFGIDGMTIDAPPRTMRKVVDDGALQDAKFRYMRALNLI